MLEANRLILDDLEERIDGELKDSRVEGRVVIEKGAVLERATVRGPAIVGERSRITDAYIGPYTAIAEDVTIEGAELEHSIVLAGATRAPPRVPDRGEPDRSQRDRSERGRRSLRPTASWWETTPTSRSCEARNRDLPRLPGRRAGGTGSDRAAARRRRPGRHHAQARLLPRRLDASGPQPPRGSTRGSLPAPSCSQRGDTKVALVSLDLFMVPGRPRPARRRAAGGSRLHASENLRHQRLAHPFGTGRIRQLTGAELRGAEPRDGGGPADLLRAGRPATGRPSALHLPREPDRDGDQASRRRPRTGGARLGLGHARRRDPQPQPRGAPREPRDHQARAGRAGPEDDPDGALHTIDPGSTCCGWTSSSAAVASAGGCRSAAGRSSPTTGRSRSRASSSTTRTITRPPCGSSRRACGAPGRVPRRQPVLNVYGNGNEGDMSAGLDRTGPAGSDEVGRLRGARRCSRPGAGRGPPA